MITNMQETSLDAFDSLIQSGVLQKQEAEILKAMDLGVRYTRNELAELTGIGINAVCGRINRMLDIQVELDGKKKCSVSGNNIQAVRLK